MIRDEVDTAQGYLTDRAVQALRGLSLRDYALAGTLALVLFFVAMTGVGFLSTDSLEVGVIAHHAQP